MNFSKNIGKDTGKDTGNRGYMSFVIIKRVGLCPQIWGPDQWKKWALRTKLEGLSNTFEGLMFLLFIVIGSAIAFEIRPIPIILAAPKILANLYNSP